MAVAVRAHSRAPQSPRWLVGWRWGLRGAGLLACAAALLLTPEIVASALHGGEPLTPIGIESLLAYRVLCGVAGLSLLGLAELLPRFAPEPERLLGPLCGLLPLGVLMACVSLKSVLGPEHTAYTGLVREDSLVEYATSVAYLGAGWVAVVVALGLRRRDVRALAGLWSLLALTLMLASLEEISWGQRLFGVQTPELFTSNVQGEMNLHNLPLPQRCLHGAYIVVGLFGGLAWALVPRWSPARFREFARWILPASSLFSYFLPVALFYLVFDFTPQRWIGSDGLRFGFVSTFDQEPAELLLSLGFLLLAVQGWARRRLPWIGRSQPGSSSAPGRLRISPR